MSSLLPVIAIVIMLEPEHLFYNLCNNYAMHFTSDFLCKQSTSHHNTPTPLTAPHNPP